MLFYCKPCADIRSAFAAQTNRAKTSRGKDLRDPRRFCWSRAAHASNGPGAQEQAKREATTRQAREPSLYAAALYRDPHHHHGPPPAAFWPGSGHAFTREIPRRRTYCCVRPCTHCVLFTGQSLCSSLFLHAAAAFVLQELQGRRARGRMTERAFRWAPCLPVTSPPPRLPPTRPGRRGPPVSFEN